VAGDRRAQRAAQRRGRIVGFGRCLCGGRERQQCGGCTGGLNGAHARATVGGRHSDLASSPAVQTRAVPAAGGSGAT
jgi:hypothetical protein